MNSLFINKIHYSDNRNLRMLNKLIHQDKKIGVFGAGGYAKTLISELRQLTISVDFCVVDDIYYTDGSVCNGVEVISIEECNQRFKNTTLIIGFGLTYKNELEEMNRICELIDNSIEILDFEDQFVSYFYYLDYSQILKRSVEFQWLYDRLDDEESKDLFVDYINGRISGDMHSMIKYASGSIFDYRMDILFSDMSSCSEKTRGAEPVIIDCGAFDGNTAIQIYDYLDGHSKVYAFECDNANYQMLRNNTKNKSGIMPIKKGVWEKTTTLKYSGEEESVFVINNTEGDFIPQDIDRIDVVALDDFIHEPVSAIIMDIEGAELNALLGAKKLIKQYKPALAIRLYHKADDFTKIPSFIDEITNHGLSYKFYLRYDCQNRGRADLTLYAV